MDIHQRLLFSLIGIAAGVVVLFGMISYRIAVDAGTAKEAELLQHLTASQAAKLASDLVADRQVPAAQLWLDTSQEYVASVLNARGDAVTGPSVRELLRGHALPQGFAAGTALHGRVGNGGEYMIWAAAPIPGSDLKLLSIHRSDLRVSDVFQHVGAQLLAAALVVIFLAVWGASLLSGIITRRLAKQHAQWIYQAEHDKLTDLANRDRLHQRLTELILKSDAPCPPLALMVIDLNRFKEINDTLGHKVGDEVLQQVAAHLRHALPRAEIIARLGGDEFALLFLDADLHSALAAAQRVQRALALVVKIQDIEFNMQASVGIALYPDHGADTDVLIRCAEVAMYNAKRQGVSHVVYAQDFDPYNVRRLMLMGDLRRAIEGRQLVLYYQPKVDLRSNRTVGVEALLRWRHPTQGFISPSDFIPLAEQGDLIRQLTYWVVDEALSQARAWRQAGISLDIAVNLSARNLHDPGLPAKVAGLLAKWSVPAAQLTLEITENAIMIDPERALKILDRLHNMGIKLSIDDFGTGYSSLVYLKKLPVSQIKIDRSFVMDMIRDDNDAIIVRSTIDLGHNLGCHIVAEGVESEEILQHLRSLGCDYVQGYYLSRPVSSQELIAWTSESAWAMPGDKLIAASR